MLNSIFHFKHTRRTQMLVSTPTLKPSPSPSDPNPRNKGNYAKHNACIAPSRQASPAQKHNAADSAYTCRTSGACDI